MVSICKEIRNKVENLSKKIGLLKIKNHGTVKILKFILVSS